jgi:very-short-patch-repair endonuclease
VRPSGVEAQRFDQIATLTGRVHIGGSVRHCFYVQRLPDGAVLAGASAAMIHGLDLGRALVEIAVPLTSGVRSRRGLLVRHLSLAPGDVVTVRGMRVTSLLRTLRDICVCDSRVEALIAIDMALCRRRTNKQVLLAYVVSMAGKSGAARMRRLVELAEPAESPMETRLRWLLIAARLPRPEVQTDLYDAQGRFVGRADLYYREARLVIEFDGGNHRERLVSDDRRQNLLMTAGFRVLRFTAADVHHRPDVIEAQVRSAVGRVRRVA